MNIFQARSPTYCILVHVKCKKKMCEYACVLIFNHLFTGISELRSQKLPKRGKCMIFHSEQSIKRTGLGRTFDVPHVIIKGKQFLH